MTYAKMTDLPLAAGWDAYDWSQVLDDTPGEGHVGVSMIKAVEAMYSTNSEVMDAEGFIRGYYDTDLAALVELHSGKWATLHAGNDTTGWGCHGDYVDWRIFASRDEAIRMGLTNQSRVWLKLELPDD